MPRPGALHGGGAESESPAALSQCTPAFPAGHLLTLQGMRTLGTRGKRNFLLYESSSSDYDRQKNVPLLIPGALEYVRLQGKEELRLYLELRLLIS